LGDSMSTLKVDTVDTRTGTGNITFSRPTVLTAGDIVTADIADDAVTLAKMAGGVDGNIISYDASGDPVAVVTGSSGQVLTSAGAGAPPTFAAAGGGAWTLIGTVVASNDATLTQTGLDSTYDHYAVVMSDMHPTTDGTAPQLRLGDSSGIDSSAGDYAYHFSILSEASASYLAANSASADSIVMAGGSTGNAAAEGFSGIAYIGQPGDGAIAPVVHGSGIQITDGGIVRGGGFFGFRQVSIVTTQVRFSFGSGNVSTGRMSVYGISHS
jgi:hypothetical protein